jgi:hypothetical protein
VSIQGLLKDVPKNLKGLSILVLLLVLVGGLVYLPELVSVTSPKQEKQQPPLKDSPSKVVAARELAQRVGSRQENENDPFDKVIKKIDAGEYEKLTAAGVEAAVIPELTDSEPKSFWARIFSPVRKDKGLKALRGNKVAQRKVLMQGLRSGKPTWDILQLPVVLTTIQRASKESDSLFQMLPPHYAESRLAVRNYVAGLEYFQSREIRRLSPHEGLLYLKRIDRDVTESLISDKVGRDIFNVWRNISLETLLITSGALDYRDSLAPPFIADIIVTGVSVRDEDTKKMRVVRRKLRWDLTISGFVESAAATQIELLGPGHLRKKANLPSTNDGKWRSFSFSTSGSPYGQFIIRTSDNEGGFFEKNYNFIKMGLRYRNRQTGDYAIPMVNTNEKDRPIDRLLDRLFFVGITKSSNLEAASAYISGGNAALLGAQAPADTVPF